MISLFRSIVFKLKPFYFIKLLSSFLTQIGSLFLIYLFKPEQYGFLSLIISVAQLMFIFTSGWSNGAIVNLGTKSYAEKGTYNDIVVYRTFIVLISFLIVSMLFWFFKVTISNYILNGYSLSLTYLLFLAYVFFDFSSQLLFPGDKNFMQSLIELIATLAFVILVFNFVRNVRDYVWAYFITQLFFTTAVILLFVHYFGQKSFRWNNIEFLFVLKYSFWQIISIIGIYLTISGVNYLFLFYGISVKEIGLYNFAFRLFTGFTPVFALLGVIVPKWIHVDNKSRLQIILKKRIFFIVLILAILYMSVALIIKPLLILVGKNDYTLSAKYFTYLFPAFIFMSYGNILNVIVMNTKFFKQAQFAIVFQGAVMIASGLVFINFFGTIGAIVALSLAYISGAIYLHLLYSRRVFKSTDNSMSFT